MRLILAHTIVTGGLLLAVLEAGLVVPEGSVYGRFQWIEPAEAVSQPLSPILRANHFLLPEDPWSYRSDDGSVEVSVSPNTYDTPVQLSLIRVFHGEGKATDNPNPAPPREFETYASILLTTIDPMTDELVEPTKPITIQLLADIEDDRATNLTTLRIARESNGSAVAIPGIINRDVLSGLTSASFQTMETGRFLLSTAPIGSTNPPSPAPTTVINQTSTPSPPPQTQVEPTIMTASNKDTRMNPVSLAVREAVIVASSLVALGLIYIALRHTHRQRVWPSHDSQNRDSQQSNSSSPATQEQ